MTVTIRIEVSRQRGARGTIMPMESARKLVGGAIGLIAGVARHAVWYLRYQVDGVTRDQGDDQPEP
jgi:hypothetical protein